MAELHNACISDWMQTNWY